MLREREREEREATRESVLPRSIKQEGSEAQEAADGDADHVPHRLGDPGAGHFRLFPGDLWVWEAQLGRGCLHQPTSSKAGNVGNPVAYSRSRHGRDPQADAKILVNVLASNNHDGVIQEAKPDKRDAIPDGVIQQLPSRRGHRRPVFCLRRHNLRGILLKLSKHNLKRGRGRETTQY